MLRVAPDEWYQVHALSDAVTLISEPHIKEFFRCNIWHISGRDRDLLFDSGMGVVSLREYVPVVTQKTCVAVTSHTHFDHIGCHHEFPQRLVHPAEAGLLANPTRANTLAETYARDDIFTALPPQPYASVSYAVKKAPATGLIEDGDVIELGDRHFEVIHTPGHSPGGVALWEEKTGILFSGDVVYDGPLIEDVYHSNLAHYIDSMKRLYEFPVNVVHGGHFASYDRDRHRNIIRNWLASHDSN